ncbi:MAG: glutaredoxin 3, partial [Legionellales bacterium]|nr:glutaredoxin 3 [Legionellales bacterium]
YTKNNCPYCNWAKDFFNTKNISYQEINIEETPNLLTEMLEKSNGHRTFPQIFINEQHIGGYDDLMELHNTKRLTSILAE